MSAYLGEKLRGVEVIEAEGGMVLRRPRVTELDGGEGCMFTSTDL